MTTRRQRRRIVFVDVCERTRPSLGATASAATQRGVCGQDVGKSFLLLLSSFVLRIIHVVSVWWCIFALPGHYSLLLLYMRHSADTHDAYLNIIMYVYIYRIHIIIVLCVCVLIICYYLLPIRAAAVSRNLISKHA